MKKGRKSVGISAFKKDNELSSLSIEKETKPVIQKARDTIQEEMKMATMNNERELKYTEPERRPRRKSNPLKQLKSDFDMATDKISFLNEVKDSVKALPVKQQKQFIDYIKNKYY